MSEADTYVCIETVTVTLRNGWLRPITKQATFRMTFDPPASRATLALARGYLIDQSSKRGQTRIRTQLPRECSGLAEFPERERPSYRHS